MIKRLRRVIAAALIPFVLFWSIMIPRQAYAFAPVGAAPIVIVGTMASGAVVPILVGAAIAGIAYWAFQDISSLNEVRVPAVDGAAGVPPAPTGLPGTIAPIVKYSFGSSGVTCDGTVSNISNTQGEACTLLGGSVLKTQNSNAGYNCTNRYYDSAQATLVDPNTCNVKLTRGAAYGGGQVDFGNNSLQLINTCANGYTMAGSNCNLTNARAADTKLDFQRAGTSHAVYSGDTGGSLSATTMTTTASNDTVVVVGKDADGNAMQGKIIAKADGGSKVELKTQKQSATGQTYVETKTFETSSTGDVTGATQTATGSQLKYDPGTKQYTEVAAPVGTAAPNLSPTSEGTTFPSDYARQGEAGTAAQVVTGTLGPKLDKLVETSAAPADLIVPESSGYTDFGNTFTGLLGWQLPGHSSQCPTASFMSPWNTSYTVDSHCQLISTHWTALQGAMAVVWTIAALFVVLRA